MRIFYVYIVTNKRKNVLYIGVTNNLQERIRQHKWKVNKGFTEKYNVSCLVYYEEFDSPYEAIRREKQLKGWRRAKKELLIRKLNPLWNDLSEGWF